MLFPFVFMNFYLNMISVYENLGDFENFNLNATTGVITIKNNLDRDSDTMRNTGGVYAMTVKVNVNYEPMFSYSLSTSINNLD